MRPRSTVKPGWPGVLARLIFGESIPAPKKRFKLPHPSSGIENPAKGNSEKDGLM
jgi:hypothetical protein